MNLPNTAWHKQLDKSYLIICLTGQAAIDYSSSTLTMTLPMKQHILRFITQNRPEKSLTHKVLLCCTEG